MSNNEKIYKNLHLLMKMFKNRPHHLAKYLLDNNALTPEFIKKIEISNKLNELGSENSNSNSQHLPVYLPTISKMDEYFNSLLDPDLKSKTPEEIIEHLSKKLDDCIKNEKYEEAARIRDYMKKKGLKKK